METVYFAGGCVWCITPTFRQMEGVYSVVSGYSCGDEPDPTYEDVKYQRTGHRETIRVDYDPERVSFARLFEIFLGSVNPFDPGGQYIDRGHSYTLAIYYLDEEQRLAAEQALARLEREAGKAPCVSLEPFKSFYMAEEEHQDYYRKHPAEFRQELIESGRLREEK